MVSRRDSVDPLAVGDEVVLEVGPIAHGGHCIAHHAGRTLLVRHTLPGERVRARVTAVASKVSRADAVEILSASPDRVEPRCAFAGPGGCGGCDFQHVALPAQRELKRQVIGDALRRFADLPDTLSEVRVVPGDTDGLHWRTRVTWQVDAGGDLGFYGARSHRVIPVAECPLTTAGIAAWRRTASPMPGSRRVLAVEDSDGTTAVQADGRAVLGPATIHQRVQQRAWDLPLNGFWQVHPGAASVLVDAVLDLARPQQGERWWDLYGGAGLFSAFLAEAIGETGSVDCVEGFAASAQQARAALRDLPVVSVTHADVRHWTARQQGPVHGVVMDPPRTGAGADVVRAVAGLRPSRVVYVACDPVALARDVRTFREHGYTLEALSAFDCFPMTHHVECVALLTGH